MKFLPNGSIPMDREVEKMRRNNEGERGKDCDEKMGEKTEKGVVVYVPHRIHVHSVKQFLEVLFLIILTFFLIIITNSSTDSKPKSKNFVPSECTLSFLHQFSSSSLSLNT